MNREQQGRKFHVVYLGESGFPNDRAGIKPSKKTILLGKASLRQRFDTTPG